MLKSMSRARNAAVAELFFALGDPTRLSLLDKLGVGQLSATELAEDAKVSRQAIVKHLQVLEGAGLLRTKKQGREVLYIVQPRRLQEVQEYLEMISSGWDEALVRLQKMVDR